MGVYTPELAHQLDKLKDQYLKERDEARAERDQFRDAGLAVAGIASDILEAPQKASYVDTVRDYRDRIEAARRILETTHS